ncbi:sigma-70 family RNA polymerase sigma factor [Loigolactobacillus zhaoyuanensis]|uniref:Sigma-70 family RNA polymerase sigma factor n=1 Tax=Loigolactobacillus zhaoyuanensis TaxID=2486017 RepID=A0ABW8UDU6_9LACO
MTNQLINAAFSHALQNKKLIFGVLKQCHITRQQDDFDDYFQECLLAYVDAYCLYEKTQPRISRQNYLYTKLCQQMIDLWRKQNRYQQFCETTPIDFAKDSTKQLNMRLAFKDLDQVLTSGEQQIFDLFYLNDFSQAEICHKLKIDRRTVYRWRAGLSRKTKKYF